ncbi:MAG: hypothetical protein SFU98_07750 [Leptospiraceae bacterium]|nr:hypothetical protein [Leptospiraceae bacterium]
MIHPNRTGNPKSQNFSFYGTSICQGYNCKNIERPTKPAWKKFFDKQDYNSLIYSKIASDHIFIDRLEDFFSSLGKDIETVILEEEQFLKRIFQYKIEKDANPNKTSFEIDMEVDKVGREWELLVIELGLREDEEIYRGLLEKKGRAE